MANIKSQIKRNRQNERHRVRNKDARTRLKTEAKKVRELAQAGDAEATTTQVRVASRLMDKAASKGMIHPRTAARRKSKLAKAARAVGGEAPSA